MDYLRFSFYSSCYYSTVNKSLVVLDFFGVDLASGGFPEEGPWDS